METNKAYLVEIENLEIENYEKVASYKALVVAINSEKALERAIETIILEVSDQYYEDIDFLYQHNTQATSLGELNHSTDTEWWAEF